MYEYWVFKYYVKIADIKVFEMPVCLKDSIVATGKSLNYEFYQDEEQKAKELFDLILVKNKKFHHSKDPKLDGTLIRGQTGYSVTLTKFPFDKGEPDGLYKEELGHYYLWSDGKKSPSFKNLPYPDKLMY